MKNWMIVLIGCAVLSGCQTTKKDKTLADWQSGRKSHLEGMGKTYDAAKEARRFEKFDLNKDGVYSVEEQEQRMLNNSKKK